MRNRREIERERGYEQLRGTFADVCGDSGRRASGLPRCAEAAPNLRVRPVITAHPTEAKRVTVLETSSAHLSLAAASWNPRAGRTGSAAS